MHDYYRFVEFAAKFLPFHYRERNIALVAMPTGDGDLGAKPAVKSSSDIRLFFGGPKRKPQPRPNPNEVRRLYCFPRG